MWLCWHEHASMCLSKTSARDIAMPFARAIRIKKRQGANGFLKSNLDAEDARLAADTGADGLIVSNHGGRQFEDALSPIKPYRGSPR